MPTALALILVGLVATAAELGPYTRDELWPHDLLSRTPSEPWMGIILLLQRRGVRSLLYVRAEDILPAKFRVLTEALSSREHDELFEIISILVENARHHAFDSSHEPEPLQRPHAQQVILGLRCHLGFITSPIGDPP